MVGLASSYSLAALSKSVVEPTARGLGSYLPVSPRIHMNTQASAYTSMAPLTNPRTLGKFLCISLPSESFVVLSPRSFWTLVDSKVSHPDTAPCSSCTEAAYLHDATARPRQFTVPTNTKAKVVKRAVVTNMIAGAVHTSTFGGPCVGM